MNINQKIVQELSRQIWKLLDPEIRAWCNNIAEQEEVDALVKGVDSAVYQLVGALIKTVRQPYPERESWRRTVVEMAQEAFATVNQLGPFEEPVTIGEFVKSHSFADSVVSCLIELPEFARAERRYAKLERQRLEQEQKEFAQYLSFMGSSSRRKKR
jgi:hypothetical protein